MADITAEQVARAIEAARADEGGISDALGGWQWDKRAPDYVRVAWGKPSLPDFIAALTRWHAELVAVATPRAAEAERADKPAGVKIWPLPLDHAPEVVDVPQPIVKRCACPDVHDDVEAEWRPGEPYLTVTHTTVPLALLRAMLAAIDAQQGGPPKKWGSLDWLDEPEPTRPEPRYKVGDWVRVEGTGTVYQIGEIAGEYFRKMPGSASVSYKLCALTPAIDPALHETARKTVAWLRGEGPAPVVPLYDLPGHDEWASTISRAPLTGGCAEWAAQLERLLGDAP